MNILTQETLGGDEYGRRAEEIKESLGRCRDCGRAWARVILQLDCGSGLSDDDGTVQREILEKAATDAADIRRQCPGPSLNAQGMQIHTLETEDGISVDLPTFTDTPDVCNYGSLNNLTP